MDQSGEAFDCRSCAACCRDASDGRVLVSADDLVRWRREHRQDLIAALVPGHFGEPGLPARADGSCRHLGVAERPNDCSIYETRADSCRRVEPGSSECRAYRRAQLAVISPAEPWQCSSSTPVRRL